MRCENCGEVHEYFRNQCVVEVLLGVSVHARESLTTEQALTVLDNLNVDMLWEDLGPVLDNLEAGVYSNADE